eukprot:g46336.t1
MEAKRGKKERRTIKERGTGDLYNEGDVDEETMWKEGDLCIRQKVYDVRDRLKAEMDYAIETHREPGPEKAKRERKMKEAAEVWEGFVLLAGLRKLKVREVRIERERELTVTKFWIRDEERVMKESKWRQRWEEEGEKTTEEDDMWEEGEIRVGRDICKHAEQAAEEYILSMRQLEQFLDNPQNKYPGNAIQLRITVRKAKTKAEGITALANARRERYLQAKSQGAMPVEEEEI